MDNPVIKPEEKPELTLEQYASFLQNMYIRAAGEVPYIAFSGKTGLFTSGTTQAVLNDKKFLVGPRTFTQGWRCWKQGNIRDEFIWSVSKPECAIKHVDLPDYGPYDSDREGWTQTVGAQLIDMAGHAHNLTLNSRSSIPALVSLAREIGDRIRSGEAPVPVVTLGTRIIGQHRNPIPDFKVLSWIHEGKIEQYLESNSSESQA